MKMLNRYSLHLTDLIQISSQRTYISVSEVPCSVPGPVSNLGIMDYDAAYFVHLVTAVVHNFADALHT